MKFSLIARNIFGIISAFCIYWSSAVLVGLILYSIFPPSFSVDTYSNNAQIFSFMTGVSLGKHWQNIPGNIIGFVLALYTFRTISSKKDE